MEHVTLGASRVPKLGFGTWQMKGRECVDAVTEALAIGYRHIDTAEAYDNEADVGRGIAESGIDREDIFVTTKVWREHLEAGALRRSVEESLKRLGIDQLDLALVHWPNETVGIAEPLEALAELREAGKLRHLGVSNFTPSQIERALAAAPIACNQVEYHPFLAQDDHLALARRHGYMLTAFCPLARGTVVDDETIAEIGRAHGKSPTQVTLRWLIQQDSVVAVPKAAKEHHARANFEIFDFALSSEEMQRISALDRRERLIDPDFAPDWGT